MTCAAQGIRLGTAEHFVKEGARFVAFDCNSGKLRSEDDRLVDRYVRFIGDGVAEHGNCTRAAAARVERFGAIDVTCAHAVVVGQTLGIRVHLERVVDDTSGGSV